MGVSVFPAPSAGGGAALPQGATANVASGYTATGGWKYATSTAAGTYQVSIQAPSNQIYGIETANGVTMNEIQGGQTVNIKTNSTEASITIGSYYPFEKTSFTSVDGSIRSMGGGNGLFVMYSTTGYVYTSTDSLTWTNRTSGFEGVTQSGNVPGYVNDRWIIPGFTNGTTFNGALYSTNGTSWSYLDLSGVLSNRPVGFEYGAGIWVVCAAQGDTTGSLASSTNFTSWTARTSPVTNQPTAIAFGSYAGTNYFVITTIGGVILYSTNGTSWTNGGDITGNSTNANGVIYANNRFVVFGSTGSTTTTMGRFFVTYELNGADAPNVGQGAWLDVQVANSNILASTAIRGGYAFGTFFIIMQNVTPSNTTNLMPDGVISPNKMFTSTDGFTWTMRSMPRIAANVYGINSKQSNGILIYFPSLSRTYFTTAFNSAAIHINSTALTSV